MRRLLQDVDKEKTAVEPWNLYYLEQYGIPWEVLEALVFEHSGHPSLLELQQKGVRMGICDAKKLLDKNGIISGPTCSGKTLLAEFRMLVRYFDEKRRVESGGNPQEGKGKTIFLVPMKAIGLERLRSFGGLYGQFGIKVFYSDGDVRTHDGDILRTKFDVAIIVNEKFKFFEQHNSEFLRNVGEVVVDEIDMISDKSRGPYLEMAVTGLLLSPYKPTVLGLTTPLEGIEQLVGLLGGFLLESGERPIDIQAGVWTTMLEEKREVPELLVIEIERRNQEFRAREKEAKLRRKALKKEAKQRRRELKQMRRDGTPRGDS